MIKDLTRTGKALGDPQRVRALAALRGGELCLCALITLLKLAPSTVSKHMSLLIQAGLVLSRKEGRWVHYRLAKGRVTTHVRMALELVDSALRDDAQAARDVRALCRIRTADNKEISKCYRVSDCA